MSDQSSESGDEAFGKYIDGNSCPNNNISLIVLALREKVRHLSNMYNTSLGAYLKLNENEPLRIEMGKFISKLMDHSVQSLNQFDFILMDDSEEEDDPEQETPIDPPSI